MLHTSKLRSRSRNGFTRATFARATAALALLILLPLAANAYTVILLNGRSVEIPAEFSVTRAGITYQYAPGLYVTIQMTSIDIAATERANREPAGTLLSRAGKARVDKTAPASSPESASARRTLTDKDLEGTRLRREASEREYERRRAELGLPSLEASRRQREEETRRFNLLAAQAEAEEREAESYWRGRATELRTAIAVNAAELDYVRQMIGRATGLYITGEYPTLTPFPFVLQFPNRFSNPGRPFGNTGFGSPRDFTRREPLPGQTGSVGRPVRPRVPFNPRRPYTGFPRRRGFGTPGTILPLPIYAPFAYSYGDSYDNALFTRRLRELEAERAGLLTRWRLLEEEARRAGAPPGWLRP